MKRVVSFLAAVAVAGCVTVPDYPEVRLSDLLIDGGGGVLTRGEFTQAWLVKTAELISGRAFAPDSLMVYPRTAFLLATVPAPRSVVGLRYPRPRRNPSAGHWTRRRTARAAIPAAGPAVPAIPPAEAGRPGEGTPATVVKIRGGGYSGVGWSF